MHFIGEDSKEAGFEGGSSIFLEQPYRLYNRCRIRLLETEGANYELPEFIGGIVKGWLELGELYKSLVF